MFVLSTVSKKHGSEDGDEGRTIIRFVIRRKLRKVLLVAALISALRISTVVVQAAER